MRQGLLLVDKPLGLTSFEMTALVRRKLTKGGVKKLKVGHGGTLDPFATGLLVVLVGHRATRQARVFLGEEKEYVMTVRFGSETDTGDLCGKVLVSKMPCPKKEAIEASLSAFVGEVVQEAPAFSALKYRGKPLYWYARRGIEVQKPPLVVTIRALELVEYLPPDAVFHVVCGKGAYMRVLARDIARACGSAGHLIALRRVRVGRFRVEDALPFWRLEAFTPDDIQNAMIPIDKICEEAT